MSPNQVVCPQCGNTMLVTTAAETGGLCVPCASGTRSTLGVAKKRYEAFLERTKTSRAIWSGMVNRVHSASGGIHVLSPAERTYYLLSCLDAELWRGGFHTYFHNSSGNHYGVTLKALEEVNCPIWKEYLTRSGTILFPGGNVPSDTAERHKILPTWPNHPQMPSPEWQQRLDQLNSEFKPRLEKLGEVIEAFALAHQIFPAGDEACV